MKKKMKYIFFGIIVILLTACGKAQQDEVVNGECTDIQNSEEQGNAAESSFSDRALKIIEKEMPDVDLALQDYLPEDGSYRELWWDMAGDTIFRFVRLQASGGWTDGYCLQKLENPYTEWKCQTIGLMDWIEGTQCYIEVASLNGDGCLQLLLSGAERQNFYWAKWGEEGPETDSMIPIEGSYLTGDFLDYNGKNWFIDSNRYSYLYMNSEYQFYNADFTSKEFGNDKMRGSFFQVVQVDEETYVCGNDMDYNFTIWNAQTSEPIFSSKKSGVMDSEGKVIFASPKEIFRCNTFSLERFGVEEEYFEHILGFENEGYILSHVYGGVVREDGTLVILARSNGENILLEIPEEPITDSKQELEFAVSYADSSLQELVVNFNKQNAEYSVKLRMPAGDEDWEAFRDRIAAEISNGEGPDMVADNLLDIGESAHKGYLMDMTAFCVPYRERMWEAVWAAGEVDGKNYMLPYNCRLWTLVCSEKLVGQQSAWDLTQLQQCLADEEYSAIMDSISLGELKAEDVLYYLGIFGQSDGGLIDWENGDSHLNDATAVELMEFIKTHMVAGEGGENGTLIAEGKIPIVIADIYNVKTLQCLAALFQDKEVYIGFPAEEGEKSNFLSCNGVLVNQATQHKDGVESFLSYLISEQTQQKIAERACDKVLGGEFPVDKEAMEIFWNYAMEGTYVDPYVVQIDTYEGFEYESMVLTKESVEKCRRAMEEAGPMPDTGMVYSIIAEETPAYFSGNKSAQEAADAMHNRVQLYLDER